MEFVKTDKVDIQTIGGNQTLNALVIGNPCVHPERIPARAPEVYCERGELAGATKSRNGHIVIGLMQEGRERGAYYRANSGVVIGSERSAIRIEDPIFVDLDRI